MEEMTEIWVWTVWEVTPLEAASEAAAEPTAAPTAAPIAAPASASASASEQTPEPAAGTKHGAEAAPPVAGFSVEANDGHIGTVDEVSYDAGSGAIVVDTGHWIFGKKRMVPAGMIDKIDSESRVVTLSCSKADVKAAPDYDPSLAEDATHRAEVGEHYQAQRDADGSGPDLGAEPQ